MPEPASLMLLGAGLLGMMAWLSPKAHRGLDYEGGSPTRVEAEGRVGGDSLRGDRLCCKRRARSSAG